MKVCATITFTFDLKKNVTMIPPGSEAKAVADIQHPDGEVLSSEEMESTYRLVPALSVGNRVRLTQDSLLTNDEGDEILTPTGTIGKVVAIDSRPNVTIFEIHFDNHSLLLYSLEADGNCLDIVEES